jgi:hypothetical protein
MGVFGPCYIDGVPSGGQIWVAEGSAKQDNRRVNHGQGRRGGLVVLNCAIHIAAVTPRSATPAARARATSTARSPKARRAKKPSTGRVNRGSGFPTLPPAGLLGRRPATAHRRTAAEPPPVSGTRRPEVFRPGWPRELRLQQLGREPVRQRRSSSYNKCSACMTRHRVLTCRHT